MNAKLDALLTVLEEETGCYRSMAQLLGEEQEAIGLSGKLRFDHLQEQKEGLAGALRTLEERRRQLVDQLWDAADEAGTRTVSNLARQLEGPQATALLASAAQLRGLMGAVHQQNRRNQTLINDYLKLIRGSLKMLTGLMDQNPVYARPGIQSALAAQPVITGRLVRGTV